MDQINLIAKRTNLTKRSTRHARLRVLIPLRDVVFMQELHKIWMVLGVARALMPTRKVVRSPDRSKS